MISGSFNHVGPVGAQQYATDRERMTCFAVEVGVRISTRDMGRWAMMTFGKLTTFTAYLSLAFVGAIVLGLL